MLAFSAVALASKDGAQAADIYVEGQLGVAVMEDIDTNTYSGAAGGITVTGAKGTLEYDEEFMFGAEAGVQNFGVQNMRLGFGVKHMNVELDAITLSAGSITDGTTTITNASAKVSRENLGGIAQAFDNNVQLYSFNAYYDIPMEAAIKPFVGGGIGFVDIENADSLEPAFTLSAGARYNLSESVYAGVKADYHFVSGPTDELGIEYENFGVFTAAVMVGMTF
ncbi:MAG: hypothetical protein CMF64_04670 [Magnetovibrio sp.]|nr:hypothetical protein [Magnetovibrio sp.]